MRGCTFGVVDVANRTCTAGKEGKAFARDRLNYDRIKTRETITSLECYVLSLAVLCT